MIGRSTRCPEPRFALRRLPGTVGLAPPKGHNGGNYKSGTHNAGYTGEIVSQAYTIVIADDHPLVRSAIRQAISDDVANASFSEAASLKEAEALLVGGGADLLLLDIHMPGMHGLTGLCFLRAEFPSVPIAMISASTDPRLIRQAMDYGAAGYIPKSSPVAEIRSAVHSLLAGNYWLPKMDDLPETAKEDAVLATRLSNLTPQQLRVLAMVSEGKLNKQIAYDLAISEATVKSHVSAILQKLGVNSRTQAVILANRLAVDDPARDVPEIGS
ncbi:MAG: DNA-binding NarL/FixJ family response regulator [Alphaproteobacteria bacterium]|jgi:DNA-binding NarL/FixJ family response regulator